MCPLSIGIMATSAGTVALRVTAKIVIRKKLKEGDIEIRKAADIEREIESQKGGPDDVHDHRLHPQHPLKFLSGTTPFVCGGCSYEGEGDRYRCESCKFELHRACAVSDEIKMSLSVKNPTLRDIVHEHQLTLVSESSNYSCGHCNDVSKRNYRYKCETCKVNYDLMCATHPTRLFSFLHPQHELELKTMHHWKKCAVCRHSKDVNSKVYSCEECEFYVHPACAEQNQYIEHPLHDKHPLALAPVPCNKTVFFCLCCRKKCDRWCYLCPVCPDVYFHTRCIYPENSSAVEHYAKQFARHIGGAIAVEIAKKVFTHGFA